MSTKTVVIVYLLASFLLGVLLVVPAMVGAASPTRPLTLVEVGTPDPSQRSLNVEPTIPVVPSPSPTPTRLITVRFEGVLSDVPAGLPATWRIGMLSFLVSTETVIESDHTPIVGDYAIVDASLVGEQRTATRIQILGGGRPIEFRGIISQLPPAPYAGEWRVAGVVVAVNARDTFIAGQPTLLYYAQVVGEMQADRTVRATRITVLRPQDVAKRFEFEGPIEEMIEGFWTIAGIRGVVRPATVITGTNPALGKTAQVTGQRYASGLLIFDRIYVLADNELEQRLAGTILEINPDAGYWRIDVAGQPTEVELDSTTFIDESRARAAVGMWADVIARRNSLGFLQALRIRIARPD